MSQISLVTLNIWGGFLREDLCNYFEGNKHVDIFCLQEVYHSAAEKISTCDMTLSLDIFNDIDKILADHQGFFCPIVGSNYGLATFVRKNIAVQSVVDVLIHQNDQYEGKGPTHQRKMQCLTCLFDEKPITLCNVHGLWNGMGKTDSDCRLAQSNRIRDYVNNINHPFVLCGDFNLEPQTESLKVLKKDLKDHVEINQVTSTRTSYYQKEIKFADYIFTSEGVMATSFEVMPDVVSDHAPLYIQLAV